MLAVNDNMNGVAAAAAAAAAVAHVPVVVIAGQTSTGFEVLIPDSEVWLVEACCYKEQIHDLRHAIHGGGGGGGNIRWRGMCYTVAATFGFVTGVVVSTSVSTNFP